MKKFTINCNFGGQVSSHNFYIGKSLKDKHPLHFQTNWLGNVKGGVVPGEVLDAINNLRDIALKNHVNPEDLIVYAIAKAKS